MAGGEEVSEEGYFGHLTKKAWPSPLLIRRPRVDSQLIATVHFGVGECDVV